MQCKSTVTLQNLRQAVKYLTELTKSFMIFHALKQCYISACFTFGFVVYVQENLYIPSICKPNILFMILNWKFL
jgi:hypothetical protein